MPTPVQPDPEIDEQIAERFADALIERLRRDPGNRDLRRTLLHAAGLPVDYEPEPPGRSQEAVAESMGFSRATIRQIERRAFLKLRHQLSDPQSTIPNPQ